MTVLVAAWAAPAMVLGGFALLAGIPITVALVRARGAPRWWSGALALVHLALVAHWLLAGSAPSLSKHLSPAATALYAATGALVAAAHTLRATGSTPPSRTRRDPSTA